MILFSHFSGGYGDGLILKDLSFSIPTGSVTAIIGPNGCGKTTALRALCRQLPFTQGSLTLQGKDISQYGRRELARTVALLPQSRDIPALTVEAMVRHGRYPHQGFSRSLTKQDLQLVAEAMARTGISELAPRELKTLSGGQRQRAYIAMALAQDTPIIALDEPTTHLDLNRQFALLALVRQLREAGKTVVLVLHDLAHALEYADHLVLLEQGRLVQAGTPAELLRSGALSRVFAVTVRQVEGGYLFSPKETCG